MKREEEDEKLGLLLKKYGATKTTDEFADGLVEAALIQYNKRGVSKTSPRSWVAICITSLVIMLHLAFLIYQNPFSINPALYISIGGFIIGLWGLIAICQKHLTLKIGSV